jgi:hypothetical protein
MGVGPAAGNEAPVPAKQRLGPDAECRPALPRQKSAQRGKPGPIGRLEARPRLLAPQDLKLVTQHQDLDLLGLAAPEDQHYEREHATDGEVGERPPLGTETIGLAHSEVGRYSDSPGVQTRWSVA